MPVGTLHDIDINAIAIPAVITIAVGCECRHRFRKVRAAHTVIEPRTRAATFKRTEVEIEERLHAITIAAREHAVIDESRVLPPIVAAPIAEVLVESDTVHELRRDREDRAVELPRKLPRCCRERDGSLRGECLRKRRALTANDYR